jgi:poly(ADP-ribose) glycohydrolase
MTFFKNKCQYFNFLRKEEVDEFLKYYKYLQKLALQLEKLFPNNELPLLKTCQKFAKIVLTRRQVALIFLLSFFNFLEINQNNSCNMFLVSNILFTKIRAKFEFGRCFINYLIQIAKWLEEEEYTNIRNSILEEEITYIRDNKSQMMYSNYELCELSINEKNSLFTSNDTYIVDFANKYIGGGVLRNGCVQEEILFAIEPEAIVSLFFMQVMDNNDAIGIYNTIQYSYYEGYGDTFKFIGSAIPIDKDKIKKHKIIAIDSYNLNNNNINGQNFNNYNNNYFNYYNQNPLYTVKPFNYNNAIYYNQFNNNYNIISKDIIKRDMHKAYVGFNLINYEKQNEEKTIATGNWGCGVFGGNHELKFLEQWIAASLTGVKRLDYYTFGNEKMANCMRFYLKIKEKYKTALNLLEVLVKFKLDNNNIIGTLLS